MSSNAIPPPRNYWQGKLIRLRAIEPEDGDTFHDWNLDSETARLLDFVWPPGSLAASRAWAQKMALQEVQDDRISCVIENRDRVLVGYINAHTVDRRVGAFRYGIGVRAEHRGRGYASEAIILFLRYFFEELRYQKVTAIVYSCNAASIHLHEKLGFRLEGRLRRTVYTQGQYFDELFFGMTCEEFAERYSNPPVLSSS